MSTSASIVAHREPGVLLSLAKRLLAPSYTDLFFIFVMTWSFLAGANGWQRLFMDGDSGLHIRIGDYILAAHQVPVRDLFSFSKPGQDWIAFEWLSELTFALLHRSFGLKGVALLSGAVIGTLITVLLVYTLWRGAHGMIALGLVLMALNAINIHFHARPHLFTLLFLAAGIWLIFADRRERTPAVWLLAPLTVLWANMHGGFVLFLALLGLLVIGSAAEAAWTGKPVVSRSSEAAHYAGVSLACAAASLVNPYGLRLHAHIFFDVIRSKWTMDLVDEFKSPSFRSEQMMHFMALLFLGLIMVAPLLEKRQIVEALWIVFLAYCSLISVRHAPIYMIVATPIIAVQLSHYWRRWSSARGRRSIPGILDDLAAQLRVNFRFPTLLTPVFLVAIGMCGWMHWPTDFSPEFFPVRMVSRHADALASSRVFTFDQWADYLIYRNYPRQRVFLDGRHQYYGEKIVRDYLKLRSGDPAWKNLAAKYRFDLALCSPDTPLATLMKSDPQWRIVEDDGVAILFAKKEEEPGPTP